MATPVSASGKAAASVSASASASAATAGAAVANGRTGSTQVSLARNSSKTTADASASTGGNNSRRLVNYEALIRLFDCPVCHEWVSPPIAQCRKGHVVCGPCKSKGLKACPICKQRFSEVNNWMMEQVSAVISFPCKFHSHGCREYSLLVHKVGHEALCSYRPVSCHYSVRGCTQVLLFHLMERHVLECTFKPRLLTSVSHDS